MLQNIHKKLAIGLSLVLLAFSMGALVPINITNAQVNLNIDEVARGELPGTANTSADNQATGFSYWFSQLLRIIIVIAALLVIINLMLGAIKWITAGGDSGKVQEAQKQMTQSIIGLIVLAATVAVFQILMSFLDITLFNFTGGTGAA